jgi:hypothetical protein
MKFITIGSDPEFFILDPKGKPFPVMVFSRGTKDDPSPILNEPGFYEQRDNLSFEGNIPPSYTKETFVDNMNKLRGYFCDKIKQHNYSLSFNGVEYFEKRYLSLPEAQEFGCSSVVSSWDSYTNDFNERPTPILAKSRFRVAGLHIHIGYDDHINVLGNKKNTDILIGRLFDLFLTVPSHIIKPEPERLVTYGKYGMIRCKSYGVECRTLSTFFTQEKYLPWVWDQLMKIELFINNSDPEDLFKIIQHAHLVQGPTIVIDSIFSNIFKYFKDKEVFKLFDETKKYYDK